MQHLFTAANEQGFWEVMTRPRAKFDVIVENATIFHPVRVYLNV